MVIIATGGMPQAPALTEGEDLTTTTWDIISGAVKPGAEVLLYDDNGAQPAMSAAEAIAAAGSALEVITPERVFAIEVGGINHAPIVRALQKAGAKITIQTRLLSVHREGNRLIARLGSDYDPAFSEERIVDQVVVDHGTSPLDELYFALKPQSRNLGVVDYAALTGKGEILPLRNPEGAFSLYRIGDAIASRNVHAAIYDALRMGIRW